MYCWHRQAVAFRATNSNCQKYAKIILYINKENLKINLYIVLLRNLTCKQYTLADLIRKRMNWNDISFLQSWVARKVGNPSGKVDNRPHPNQGQGCTTRLTQWRLCFRCPWKPNPIVYKMSPNGPRPQMLLLYLLPESVPEIYISSTAAATRINGNEWHTVPTPLHF